MSFRSSIIGDAKSLGISVDSNKDVTFPISLESKKDDEENIFDVDAKPSKSLKKDKKPSWVKLKDMETKRRNILKRVSPFHRLSHSYTINENLT